MSPTVDRPLVGVHSLDLFVLSVPDLAEAERFYSAFDRHDGDAMAACYAPDAHFWDPVFGDLDSRETGEMWRMLNGEEDVVPVETGVALTIPVGTRFQFRSFGYEPLAAVGVTMPPWPGEGEAYQVDGKWHVTATGP